ncbi:MAG TPA: hypothetical protein VG963_19695 [Polyangiaceae bacterium]|nr:hypothetical protein [Polyangiaceae bacterium]
MSLTVLSLLEAHPLQGLDDARKANMNAQTVLKPVQRALRTANARDFAAGWSTFLGIFGFARTRSRRTQRTLLTAAALMGGVALVLSRSSRSRALLSRLGEGMGGSVGRNLGNLAGRVFGAHPVRTVRIADKARDMFTNPV